MAQIDNESITLSRHVSAFDVALHEYALSPREGLNRLQTSLTDFQVITQSNITHSVFHERLTVCLNAVDVLSASGAVYSKEHQLAFLEAADALLQFAIGCQFDNERVQQLVALLSSERSCWRALNSIMQNVSTPHYYNYEGRWEGDSVNSPGVEFYLKQLATLGKVSFHLDSIQLSKMSGRFSLACAQSMAWLKQRFPMFHWGLAPDQNDESLRELFELVYVLFFQSAETDRQSRRGLLDLVEGKVKSLLYREFISVLPTDFRGNVVSNARLVPSLPDVLIPSFDRSLTVFPLRCGGNFYVALQDQKQQGASDFEYLTCLGRDILPCFLYVVQTEFGAFAFDQSECLGHYSVSQNSFESVEQEWLFSPEPDIAAKLILALPLSVLANSAIPATPLLENVANVLIVQQGGRYFALPYLNLTEMEGFCALSRSQDVGVKNVWLSLPNGTVLEPWLECSTPSFQHLLPPIKNKNTTYPKNGYYLTEVDGVVFLIEASLVVELLPYQGSYRYFYADESEGGFHQLMTYEGQSFSQVLPVLFGGDSVLSEVRDKSKFSAVLELMGESVVLHLTSCDWCGFLAEGEYIEEFNIAQEIAQHNNGLDYFASWRGESILLNNENYLSFVRAIWPPAALA